MQRSLEEVFSYEQAEALNESIHLIHARIAKLQNASVPAEQVMLTLPADATDLDSAIEQSIQEYLQPLLASGLFAQVPSGAIIAFDGTLREARQLRLYDVCDGVNAPDLRNMFLRGAGANENAGLRGGADSQLPVVAVADHIDHTHNVPASASACCLCVDGAGTGFSLATHTHVSAGVNEPLALVHVVSVAAMSTVPAYYSVIWIRKK